MASEDRGRHDLESDDPNPQLTETLGSVVEMFMDPVRETNDRIDRLEAMVEDLRTQIETIESRLQLNDIQ